MLYLIDGYNLFHQTMFDTKDEMIWALDAFCENRNKRAIVVFDGYCSEVLDTKFVQVVFKGDADMGIIDIMNEREASSLILVTSDREILSEARKRKVNYIKSEDFNFQNNAPQNYTESGEEENVFLSDNDVEDQLKEFNNFKE